MNISSISPDLAKFVDTLKTAFNDRMQEHAGNAAKSEVHGDDVRRAVLALLVSGPRTADGVIAEITAISAGTWVPSESEIHLNLNALKDAGLVAFELVESKKTYSITDAGRTWLAENPQHNSDADNPASEGTPKAGSKAWSEELTSKAELAKAAALLGQAAIAVASSGSKDDIAKATALLKQTATRLFATLGRTE